MTTKPYLVWVMTSSRQVENDACGFVLILHLPPTPKRTPHFVTATEEVRHGDSATPPLNYNVAYDEGFMWPC